MTAILILRLVSGRACGQGPCTENPHVNRTEINATTGFPGTMAAPETLYGQKKNGRCPPVKKKCATSAAEKYAFTSEFQML